MAKPKKSHHLPSKNNKNKNGPHNGDDAIHLHTQKKRKKMQSFSKLSTSSYTAATQIAPPPPPPPSTADKRKIKTQTQKHPNQRPKIPFGRNDRILLLGEGDFSFARSLVLQHRCRNVLATCYDSEKELYSKYPQAEKNIRDILCNDTGRGCSSIGSEDTVVREQQANTQESGELGEEVGGRNGDDQYNHGENPSLPPQEGALGGGDDQKNRKEKKKKGKNLESGKPEVTFSVDARKLGQPTGGGKEVRTGFPGSKKKNKDQRQYGRDPKCLTTAAYSSGGAGAGSSGGPWDLICFNFPHVGGLSTDVNRQVRANQELLVAFFKACVPLLSSPEPDRDQYDDDHDSDYDDDDDDEKGWQSSDSEFSQDGQGWDPGTGEFKKKQIRTEPGQVLVTLFEGEPYTLWNIKDLARHAGLRVVTSFRFPWSSYQGYSHARTLGEVEGKRGGGRGGWKGEDRDARMYVFESKQEDLDGRFSKKGTNMGKKRKARGDSDSEVSN